MSQQLALVKSQNALPSTISPNQEIDIFKLGDVFAKSGMFDGVRDASQAIVKILAGREMGFQPFESMSNVHIIKGKPSIGAHLIAAAIKKSNRYRYKVLRQDNEACEIEFYENEGNGFQPIGKSSFTIQDARTAELLGNPTWKKFPKNMLFNRAISNGAKSFCPDVFGGAIYTPEELGANVNEDGEVMPDSASVAHPIRAVEPDAKSVDQKPTDEPSMFDEIAFELAKSGAVRKRNGFYEVEEPTDDGGLIDSRVTRPNKTMVCNCDVYATNIKRFKNFNCVHIRAVRVAMENKLAPFDEVSLKNAQTVDGEIVSGDSSVDEIANMQSNDDKYADWNCTTATARRIEKVVDELAALPESLRISSEDSYAGLREQCEDPEAPFSLNEKQAVNVAIALEKLMKEKRDDLSVSHYAQKQRNNTRKFETVVFENQ